MTNLVAGPKSLSLAGNEPAAPLGYYSWTLGQAARDPLYILIVIYIFFPYFSNVVIGDPVRGQALVGYVNTFAGIAMALTVPFLGAIADKTGHLKPWLLTSTLSVSVCAFGLWWVTPDSLQQGLGLLPVLGALIVMNVAFAYTEVFHNAMLPRIAPADKAGLISGLAFALGNFGGVSLMLLVLFAFALPGTVSLTWIADTPWFGIDQTSHQQDRIVGPIAAVWLLLFTMPVLMFTPDAKRSALSFRQSAVAGVGEVWQTVRKLKDYGNVARYLLARMFFNDGMVGVLIFGGIYASGVFGWDSSELLIFGLFSSTSAMLGAYFGGRFDDLLGSKRTLMIAVCASAVIFLFMLSIAPGRILFVMNVSTETWWSGPFFNTPAELVYFASNQIFAVFFVTGLSTSRTLMARISPPAMSAQFFALYGLSGSVTAFLAPLLVATTTDAVGSARIGMSALVVLIVLGVWLLAGVKETQACSFPEEN